MRQELTWGAAAVAIVAAVGISTQSGSKPQNTVSGGRQAGHAIHARSVKKTARTVCDDPLDLLQSFFMQDIVGPASCYEPEQRLAPVTDRNRGNHPELRFMIATLPDPLHTHFSLLFDRFIEAIQQGAQDQEYDYDSSWLPWETDDPVFSNLKDQEDEEGRKAKREDQPGILLFRNSKASPFQTGLVVFVVGEESTRGIHRTQFENAVAWIKVLRGQNTENTSVAILGPTFSGSFPSLSQLLSKDALRQLTKGGALPVYSGSASSGDAGRNFAHSLPQVDFRSFVQDDDVNLERFCRYLGKTVKDEGQQQTEHGPEQNSEPKPENTNTPGTRTEFLNLAILSEDETAYGNDSNSSSPHPPSGNNELKADEQSGLKRCTGATWIYYPRDISTLRAAYQSQSMFNPGTTQPSQDNSGRKSLPTDLADPAGQQHDTVRSYASNQATLSQEAQLLGIVEALKAHKAEYVVLRSSNTLDPLFLANFLRREYPEARIIVLDSDLLFQRGRDALALNGVMTLSTYPLFPMARDWISLERQSHYSHRVFPENSAEGTYIASRVLIQALAPSAEPDQAYHCRMLPMEKGEIEKEYFAPALRCSLPTKRTYVPIPDYGPPYWMKSEGCGPKSLSEPCRPTTWLSVITKSGTWPLAALNETTIKLSDEKDPWIAKLGLGTIGPTPDELLPRSSMPRSMKLLLIFLAGLSLFHAACCWFPSFTAKPAFRAHFATAGWQHRALVLIGSYLIALMGLLAGWGDGVFARVPTPSYSIRIVWILVETICGLCGLAMILNIVATRRLNPDAPHQAKRTQQSYTVLSILIFFVLVAAFFLSWVYPLEDALRMANRSFAYWRSVNLTSGVSPIVPFLSLTMGLYVWFWYSLHGLALFGPDRPRLPSLSALIVHIHVDDQQGGKDRELKLSMFSQENAGTPSEKIAAPLAKGTIFIILFQFLLLWLLVTATVKEVPVRTLAATHYARIFCFWLGVYISLILAQGWQLWRTWSSVRQLLVFLDRLPLRRTLAALRGFSWGSVWKMSGNVLDVRYKVLSRQLECLTHLHNSLKTVTLDPASQQCLDSIKDSRAAGFTFAEWYSYNYNNPRASGMGKFRRFQWQVAETTGIVLTQLLIPASRNEEHSLLQIDPDNNGDKKDDRKPSPPPSDDEVIRNGEELVCLTYLSFVQNLLGRIRTIVLGGISLFIAATIAVSNYPFDPRPVLSGVLLVLFVVFGGVIVFVYADMHRDATLSHVTQTNPGELGTEFWGKLIGYGAAPLLGLLTTIFPQWSGILFSWLQPGLSSMK